MSKNYEDYENRGDYYEKEGDEPRGWETDVILVRSDDGNVTRIEVEDDKGGDE